MNEKELYQEFLNAIAECDKASILYSQLSFPIFVEKLKPYTNKIKICSQNYRMVQTPNFNEKIPAFGTIMSLEDFKNFTNLMSDYDGYGEYVNEDDTLSGINIYPSDVVDGKIRSDFNKIAWFNR